MSTPEPGEPLTPGAPRWGEPRRRAVKEPIAATHVAPEHVDQLVARRAARAHAEQDAPSPTAVDDLLARRAARAATAPASVEHEET